MRYFNCPKVYRSQPYGCGRGPYNGTQAMLDLWGTCPCGLALKPYKPARVPVVSGATCAVTGVDGVPYCTVPVHQGTYCARHAYLAHSVSTLE